MSTLAFCSCFTKAVDYNYRPNHSCRTDPRPANSELSHRAGLSEKHGSPLDVGVTHGHDMCLRDVGELMTHRSLPRVGAIRGKRGVA